MISKNPMKIAISSRKGGTGKTTLSTNIAPYLFEQKKTVLIDLDVVIFSIFR
jgi:cellulose biosynthesis protein BcsQ